MVKYVPDGDLHDTNCVNSCNSAMALEAVLKACADDLSTENILKQACAIKDLELPMLLPGIKINTSTTDHVPIDQIHALQRQDLGTLRGAIDRELEKRRRDVCFSRPPTRLPKFLGFSLPPH